MGPEITEEEEIKKEIIKINENLNSNTPKNEETIFYMLETPIKNIRNDSLLGECYFMDIPGLNEYQNSYIDIIFSRITLEDIKFEILIFDSTSIDSNNTKTVIENLKEKNCLKQAGNLFILNKIDQVTGKGEEDIIDEFNFDFYKNFEDHKNKENEENKVYLSINDNYFVPMNSILYEAETKYDEDFYSMLVFEYFMFLENKDDISSIEEYFNLRIEKIKKYNNIQNFPFGINSVGNKEMEIIKKSIERVKILSEEQIKKFDINIDEGSSDLKQMIKNLGKKNDNKKNHNVLMKTLFLIHKNKMFMMANHSMFYQKIDEFFRVCDNLSSAKSLNNEIKEKSQKSEKPSIIEQFGEFLDHTFQEIDKEKELEIFKNAFVDLKEDITGKKVRIAFIGNINVGKSSIINSIIGKDIIPTDSTECTYRGIIIRYEDSDEYQLYKTHLIERGIGFDEYYYFENSKIPIREGIDEIKKFLKVKNRDKTMDDEDAYLLLTGKLKFFEYINVAPEIKYKIEFIDLPGADKKENLFNQNKFNEKILKFSNCCIFVNAGKTVKDNKSVENTIKRYESCEDKIFPTLRSQFIKTCLFLINKSDELGKEQSVETEKTKIINDIYKIMYNKDKYKDKSKDQIKIKDSGKYKGKEKSKVHKHDLIICFFSSKFFMKYLETKETFINLLENNPKEFLNQLFSKYEKHYIEKSFYSYLYEQMEAINNDFNLNTENNLTQVPKEFNSIMIEGFKELNIEHEDETNIKTLEEEMIKYLYSLKIQFNSADFSNSTKFSNQLYSKLDEVIENARKLREKNLKIMMNQFFFLADYLFDKKITEDMSCKEEKQIAYDNFERIIIKIEKVLSDSYLKLKKYIEEGIKDISKLINDEIRTSYKLKQSKDDVEKAFILIEEEVKKILKCIENKRIEEINNLNIEIKNLLIEGELELNKYQENNSNISENQRPSISESFLSNVLTSISNSIEKIGTEKVAGVSASIAAGSIGALAGLAFGLGIGLAIGLTLGIAKFIIDWNKGKKYKEALIDYQKEIEKSLREFEENRDSDYKIYHEQFQKEIDVRKVVYKKDINSKYVDEKLWESLKTDYQILKLQFLDVYGNFLDL